MTYDYENRLVSVSGGGISASFVYDADAPSARVKGTINSVTTVYVAGLYEYQTSAISTTPAMPTLTAMLPTSTPLPLSLVTSTQSKFTHYNHWLAQ